MRLSLWKPNKTNDYRFIDRVVREQFDVGGTGIYVHKYLGPYPQGNTDDLTSGEGQAGGGELNEMTIQDLLFLENRDRRYDPHIYEMRAHYTVQDNDFDLTQFGLMLANDTIFMVVHYNDMIETIGRKLMSGDVVEVPHRRDTAPLDEAAAATNHFYVIQDAQYASEGYSPKWYPHLWRLKMGPLTDSPEFRDILGTGQNEDDLKNALSTYNDEIGISDAILEQARLDVPERNFQTAHLYVIPDHERGGQYPWLFAGDGEPPNGAIPLGSGDRFPLNAESGDYFLRTDFVPNVLYRKCGRIWQQMEVDYRQTWHAAHRILQSFIGTPEQPDPGLTLNDGSSLPERQNIRNAVRPKANL